MPVRSPALYRACGSSKMRSPHNPRIRALGGARAVAASAGIQGLPPSPSRRQSQPVDTPIVGTCDARFAGVREEFARNFAERDELGAAVCVVVDGETVVDLAGGWTDAEASSPWQLDTLVDFYSVGKAFLALCALALVDDGVLRLDEPIARVWPEFAAAGKDQATLRHALCHRAAVPAIRTPLTNEDLWDWDRMADALAATEPWWEPGTCHAYHTNTYGHLIGEIVRRASGETVAQRLAQIAGPLGADVHVGVPRGEGGRCASVVFVAPDRSGDIDPGSARRRSAHGDAQLFQPTWLLLNGSREHAGVAGGRGPVHERARHGAWRGADVRRAAPSRHRLVSRTPRRGGVAAVGGFLPDSPRRGHLRSRLQAHRPATAFRSQPAQLRSLWYRGCGRLRRP